MNDELPEEIAVREYFKGRGGLTVRSRFLIGRMKKALREKTLKEAIEIFGNGKVRWDEDRKCVTEV